MPSHEYWAGFFDGEGSVSITNGGRVQVVASQKYPEVLNLMKLDFGGHVYHQGQKYSFGYNWKVCDKKRITNFLNAVLPYSIVKKKEIELGLRAVDLIRSNNLGCNPLHSDDWIKRLGIREEMQALRPKKNFKNLISEESRYRAEIKKQFDFKCSQCGADLKNVSPVYQIIRNNKLICRKCNALMNIREIKPLTKEQIQEAISSSKNLNEACSKLGIVRSALYQKRMRLGLPDRIKFRGNYKI